jgi:hypothetical protein
MMEKWFSIGGRYCNGWFGIGDSTPTAGNAVSAALANANSIITDGNELEQILASGTMADILNLQPAVWTQIENIYLGAGEEAFHLSGTEMQQVEAAVAGGDVVAASKAIPTSMVPHSVKCALAHIGRIGASINLVAQQDEALNLAVTAAMATVQAAKS